MQSKVKLENIRKKVKCFLFFSEIFILPSESLRLSLDEADESGRWFFVQDR
jgi:hypothetical protein